jgi:photosystem II stability/assembly factor-like uncharacterized protein
MKKLTSLTLFTLALSASLSAQDTPLIAGDYFGDMKARQIGPALMSGRVGDIEGHPSNSEIIYIGAAGGGVWKSQDAGVTFNPIFDEYCQSIGAIAVSPSDPDNTLWVGTGETWTRNSVTIGDGIYKSSDSGKSWKKMGLEKSERISAIEVHPKNNEVVYAGVLGALWSNSAERGVYKTTDGGKTWNKILFVNETTGCSELIMDPTNPEVLYAAFWEFRRTAYSFNSGGLSSALYKTTDGGKTWNKIHTGFPAGKLGRIAVAVAPSNSNILYAVVEAEKDKGLYRSDDGGANWKFLNGDFGLVVRPFYFSRITIDPKNPDIVYKAGLYGYMSRDGGKTFKSMGSMHSDIHDYWVDPNDSQRVFAATDGGVYRSTNSGTTMQIVENLPLSQFYHVSIDNREPFFVYGGLQDNNSWFGPSDSPGGIEARDWELVGQGDGFRVYPHPTQPHVVYSEMQGAEQVWRYDTKSRQLKNIKPFAGQGDPKLRFNWNTPITTSTHNPDRLYIGSQFLHLSNDRGDTWKKISLDLTTNNPTKQMQEESGGLSADNSGAENHCTIFTIADSPKNEKVIWVGTDDGQIQVSKDGGATWTNVTANVTGLPANTWCYHIEASVFGEGTAYAVFEGHTTGDFTPYLYKTTDYGATWKSIVTSEITTFIRSVQEDFVNQNLLYVGAENGLYITLDGGAHWSRFTNNMPAVAVHYLELDKKSNSLVMATHGRGIIILDHTEVLSELTPKAMQAAVYFFPTRPFVMSEKSSFGGTSTEHQFVGDNPSDNARISYLLPKRHTFGKMTMEVVDESGKRMAKLEPGKQKGINTVEWGFSSPAPKSAKGKTLAGGALFAPRVKAGTYTVKLTKGNETFETKITTVYDPQSPFTLKERESQQQVTLDLFNFTEDLAYLVYQIDTWDAALEEHTKGQSKPAKYAVSLNTGLDAIREVCVVTKGDNYVGTGEPRLREKLGDIYSTIGGYYGAPSSSQLENVAALRATYAAQQAAFEKLKNGDLKKFEAELAKGGKPAVVILSKEDFLKED